MGRAELIITPEWLQTDDHIAAVVWRYLKANGPSTAMTLRAELDDERSRYGLRMLQKRGWLDPVDRVTVEGQRNKITRWSPRDSTRIVKQKKLEMSDVIQARERLTIVRKDLHEARTSGLAVEMSKAIVQARLEILNIRDELLTIRTEGRGLAAAD